MQFAAFVLVLFGSIVRFDMVTVAAGQPDILHILKTTIEGVVPCIGPCLMEDITTTYIKIEPCLTKAVKMVNGTIQGWTTYKEFYNKILVNIEAKPSVFCSSYGEVMRCFNDALSGLCGSLLTSHFKELTSGLISYANCNEDMLPLVKCAAHPDICVPASSDNGYRRCVEEILVKVDDYLDRYGRLMWEKFYNESIIEDGGKIFKDLVETFAQCTDVLVNTVKGCDALEWVVYGQMMSVHQFMDYNNKVDGTDALKCFGHVDVHDGIAECAQRFVFDLESPLPPALEPVSTVMRKTALLQYLGHSDIKTSWNEILLWMRVNFLPFSSCVRMVTEKHCGFHWSAKEVTKILKPSEDFFNGLRPEVEPPGCQEPDLAPDLPSGGTCGTLWWALLGITMVVTKFPNTWY